MTGTGGPYTGCRRIVTGPPIPLITPGSGRPVGQYGESRCASPTSTVTKLPMVRSAKLSRAASPLCTGDIEIARGRHQEAFRDGWLRSGDMGYVDDNGFLFIVDRLKDMIVSGGENVYSAEVETALTRIGPSELRRHRDSKRPLGEQVHAVVVLREGARADATELRDHCRKFIAGCKCPVSVGFVESLPCGAGKSLKHVLRKSPRAGPQALCGMTPWRLYSCSDIG